MECADCHPECHIVKPPFLFSCNCHFSDLRDQEAGLFPFTAFPRGRTLDSFSHAKMTPVSVPTFAIVFSGFCFFDGIR